MPRAALPILVLLAGLVPTAAAAQQGDLTTLADELGQQIVTRPVASGGSVSFGRAVGVVDAPIDRVMRVVTDYAHYADFMPKFETSRVLSRRGNNAMVYMEVTVGRNLARLWAQLRIYNRRPRGETRIIECRMSDGNMDNFVARWEITPIDEARTMVVFKLLVDPDLPIPSSIVTNENVSVARRAIRAVRNQVRDRRYAMAPRR